MLTIWSKPQVMKSMNCISAMGRMPMVAAPTAEPMIAASARSEEHTSELQSRLHLVCRLLLEKKKKAQLIDRFPRVQEDSWSHRLHEDDAVALQAAMPHIDRLVGDVPPYIVTHQAERAIWRST